MNICIHIYKIIVIITLFVKRQIFAINTDSHFQSQIKEIDPPTFNFQQQLYFSNLFSKSPGCHIRFQINT